MLAHIFSHFVNQMHNVLFKKTYFSLIVTQNVKYISTSLVAIVAGAVVVYITRVLALSRHPNREKSIVGSPRGEFYIKSGKNRAAAARTSTPEVLILYSSGGGRAILTRS